VTLNYHKSALFEKKGIRLLQQSRGINIMWMHHNVMLYVHLVYFTITFKKNRNEEVLFDYLQYEFRVYEFYPELLL
jgi:hypothetical protein